jgi:hypothetical protein
MHVRPASCVIATTLLAAVATLCTPAAIAQPASDTYAAAFVTQSVPPALEIGVASSVSITMRNTGSATWRQADGDVFLATQRPQDNYYWCIQDNPYGSRSGNRVLLPGDVPPGADVTFAFTVKPLACGFAATPPFRFRMLSQRHGTFGEETPDPGVGVTTAAEFVTQQAPARVPAGAAILVEVTFRNTTTSEWLPAAGYALASTGPAANTVWTVKSVPLAAPVAPGANASFRFTITTPATPGTYNFQWQMTGPAGAPFGQVSPATAIAVVAPGPANYQGLWWASPAGAEAGWGINLAHQDEVIFMTWFTYDAGGRPYWLTMTANRTTAQTFTGTLLQQSGPPFGAVPFDPSQVRSVAVGTATLTFTDRDDGRLDYVVGGVRQSKAITREVFGTVPTCTFGLFTDLAAAYNYQDLWWASPAGNESGWGINLTHQGDVIFATWFTYASDRTATWVAGTLPRTGAGVYTGKLVRTSGPRFDAVPFDPARVVVTDAGTATLTFTNGNAGTFAYTLDGVEQSKAITRQIFRMPGTVCQ